jgi:hypothetical protein
MKEFSLFTVLYKTFRFFGVFFLCFSFPESFYVQNIYQHYLIAKHAKD